MGSVEGELQHGLNRGRSSAWAQSRAKFSMGSIEGELQHMRSIEDELQHMRSIEDEVQHGLSRG